MADNQTAPDMCLLTAKYPTLVDLYARFDPLILVIDRSVTPLWYLLGLFGNLLSAYVWMHPRVRKNNSSAVYLAALSVWDLIFLSLHTVQEVREAWNGIAQNNLFTCIICPVVLLTAQYLSPVLVLCFTVERWIAVWFPFRRDSLCTPRRACVVTALMVTAILAWNMPQVHFKNWSQNTCTPDTSGPAWQAYSTAGEALFSGVVPMAALIFNLLVAKELHRIIVRNKNLVPSSSGNGDVSAERRFRTTTVMLLCVSLFVILTTLPAGLMYALQNQEHGNLTFTDEQVMQDETWQAFFRAARAKKLVDEVCISHYSLNFLIYLLTGPQYRAFARQLMSRWLGPLRAGCGRCARVPAGKSGQRKEKLKEREHYYLSNSRTDRARRLATLRALAASGGSVEFSTVSQSEPVNGGGDQMVAAMTDARKPLLAGTAV